MRSLINRLGVGNIEPVVKDILTLYDENSTKKINALLIRCVLDVLSHITYVPLSCLIVTINTVIGVDLLAVLIEQSVDIMNAKYSWRPKQKQGARKRRKTRDVVHGVDNIETNVKTENLLCFLGYIYRFGGVNDILLSSLTLKIIDKLQFSANESDSDEERTISPGILHTDVIDDVMAIVEVSGVQMRKNEPAMVLDIVQAINARLGTQNKRKEDKHYQYMLERLNFLKNNRTDKFKDEINDGNVVRLKKWLKHFLNSQYSDGKSIPTLNVSVTDILNRKENGRWWIVGASFMKNNVGLEGNVKQSQADSDIPLDNVDTNTTTVNPQDSLKSTIFNAIMSSHDYQDAVERLCKLNLAGLGGASKNKKASVHTERLVIHVIMDCNARSKAYNPFYSFLAKRLCNIKHTNKFTITLQFWDFWKINSISTKSVRTISNYCKFLSHLVGSFTLSLAIFKVIEFHTIERTKELVLFLHMFMKDLIANNTKETLNAVFERITVGDRSQTKSNKSKGRDAFENDPFFDDSGDDSAEHKKSIKNNGHAIVKNGFKWFVRKFVRGTRIGNSKDEILRNNEKVIVIMDVLSNSLIDL